MCGCFPASRHARAPGQQVEDQDHKRYNEQQVNQTTSDMKAEAE
jgi:hypothetical protein